MERKKEPGTLNGTLKVFGIDQTGASVGSARAKPLKACELILNLDGNIHDLRFFAIPHLGEWVKTLKQNEKNHIFIDCVFGLPIRLHQINPSKSIRDWIYSSKDYTFLDKHFGSAVSQSFFAQIKYFYKIHETSTPRREQEIQLNSNSVFTIHPFQKNIQTGTFRIWKELSQVLDEILIWPIDYYLQEELNVIFYEVYPSYFYKKLFNVSSRSAGPVIKYLNDYPLKLNSQNSSHINNSDFCDALVAALGGYNCLKTNNFSQFFSDEAFFEGQILTIDENSNSTNPKA